MRAVVKPGKSEWREEKWSTTGIDFGTNNVCSICKLYDRTSKQLHKSVCR